MPSSLAASCKVISSFIAPPLPLSTIGLLVAFVNIQNDLNSCEAVQAPLQKLEHQLHAWVAFGIVPLFALANAGVRLSLEGISGPGLLIVVGTVLGLVVGKPLGLVGLSWVLVRTGVAALPQGVRWAHLVGAGCLAGLGFTMSLFIASLGFGESPLLEAAKLGILTASLIAGVLGFTLLRRVR